MSVQTQRYYSPEEYLAQEEAAEYKIEGKPVYYGTGTTTVTNPLFIVEVLSNSTRNYDQGDKFLYYRSIPELKEYILIEQDYFYVMQWSKTAQNKWLLTEYESGDASVSLESVNFKISLKYIYEGVNFDKTEE